MSEWQAIETAPRDGTGLLGWWPHWTAFPVRIWWQHNQWHMAEDHPATWHDDMPRDHGPTHWMPLPSPPDAAALDRLSGRVTVSVKPLEWDVHADHPDVQEYYAGDQNNLAGENEYIISPHPCATGYFVIDCMGRRANEDFPSVETAKAAAQADYESRILAAIDTAPAPSPDQIRREALRGALAVARDETTSIADGDGEIYIARRIADRIEALITGGDDDAA